MESNLESRFGTSIRNISDEDLRKDASTLTVPEIAEKYGICRSTAYKTLKKRGINKKSVKNWKRDDMILAGCTLREIADANGVSKYAVSGYIHWHNLTGIWNEAKQERAKQKEAAYEICYLIDKILEKRLEG